MDLEILQKSYDRFAPRYEEVFLELQRPKIEGLDALLPELPEPCVDLGAGTGLWRRLTGRPCFALDLSRGMLLRASGPRVQGDLHHLPFGNQSLGSLISLSALLGCFRPRPILVEMRRVLRLDGLLALSVLKVDAPGEVERLLSPLGFELLERLDLEQDLGFIVRRRL